MPYVSCRYAPPPDPNMPGSQQMIICVDDQGQEWWIPPDCQVGDWLRFVEEGGTVEDGASSKPATLGAS